MVQNGKTSAQREIERRAEELKKAQMLSLEEQARLHITASTDASKRALIENARRILEAQKNAEDIEVRNTVLNNKDKIRLMDQAEAMSKYHTEVISTPKIQRISNSISKKASELDKREYIKGDTSDAEKHYKKVLKGTKRSGRKSESIVSGYAEMISASQTAETTGSAIIGLIHLSDDINMDVIKKSLKKLKKYHQAKNAIPEKAIEAVKSTTENSYGIQQGRSNVHSINERIEESGIKTHLNIADAVIDLSSSFTPNEIRSFSKSGLNRTRGILATGNKLEKMISLADTVNRADFKDVNSENVFSKVTDIYVGHVVSLANSQDFLRNSEYTKNAVAYIDNKIKNYRFNDYEFTVVNAMASDVKRRISSNDVEKIPIDLLKDTAVAVKNTALYKGMSFLYNVNPFTMNFNKDEIKALGCAYVKYESKRTINDFRLLTYINNTFQTLNPVNICNVTGKYMHLLNML